MLNRFVLDEKEREEVRGYLISYLRKRAIEKVFERQDTLAIAEAKDLIDEAFDDLISKFTPKLNVKTENEAR